MRPLLLLLLWPVLVIVCVPLVLALGRASARADDDAAEDARRLSLRQLARRRRDRRRRERRTESRAVPEERRHGDRRVGERRRRDPVLGTFAASDDEILSAAGPRKARKS